LFHQTSGAYITEQYYLLFEVLFHFLSLTSLILIVLCCPQVSAATNKSWVFFQLLHYNDKFLLKPKGKSVHYSSW